MPSIKLTPREIEEYIKWDRIEKDAKKHKEQLRPKVLKLLEVSKFDGIERRVQQKTVLNQELAMEWARDNLSKEQRQKLYPRAFDPNKFLDMMKQGQIKRAMLPPDILDEKATEQIWVTNK